MANGVCRLDGASPTMPQKVVQKTVPDFAGLLEGVSAMRLGPLVAVTIDRGDGKTSDRTSAANDFFKFYGFGCHHVGYGEMSCYPVKNYVYLPSKNVDVCVDGLPKNVEHANGTKLYEITAPKNSPQFSEAKKIVESYGFKCDETGLCGVEQCYDHPLRSDPVCLFEGTFANGLYSLFSY